MIARDFSQAAKVHVRLQAPFASNPINVSSKRTGLISLLFPKQIEFPVAKWCFRAARKIYAVLPISIFLLMAKPAAVASAITTEKANVLKIDSINEMLFEHPKDTIVFFDLDDTAFDSPYMLGSKAWRKYIVQATKHLDRNWHDILTLMMTRKLQLITVEPDTVEIIKSLKSKGCITSGLTARERQRWYDTQVDDIDKLTVSQLKSVDIDFDNETLKERYPALSNDSEYYEGVFFANTDLKGDYLKKVLQNSADKPVKVVFIDDKLTQVESVAITLREMQIPHECYWYCAIESKAAQFNPLIANIQLYYFWMSDGNEVLTDLQAESIAKSDPEKDADFYLQAVLTNNKVDL